MTRKSILLWFDASRLAMDLPLLEHVHDGRYEALALIAPVEGANDQRLVLRLWSTENLLLTERTPIWIGTVTQERITRPLTWFKLPRDGKDFNAPRHALLESLSELPMRIVRRHAVPESASKKSVWDNTVLLIHQLDFSS